MANEQNAVSVPNQNSPAGPVDGAEKADVDMQEGEQAQGGAEAKKQQESQEEAELPYFCVTCRKAKGPSNQKKAQSKGKSKKAAPKSNIKRCTSNVSKSSPKNQSIKEASVSPESSEKDIQDDPVTVKKELTAGSTGQSKLRGKTNSS